MLSKWQMDCRSVAAGRSNWGEGASLGGFQQASGYGTFYPSPTTRGYHGNNLSYPIGPVVSSRAFFHFLLLLFPSILSSPVTVSSTSLHMYRSLVKKARNKVGKALLSQGRRWTMGCREMMLREQQGCSGRGRRQWGR